MFFFHFYDYFYQIYCKTTKLIICLNLDAYVEAQPITTFPLLPNNTVATNYVSLQLISTITGSFFICDYERDFRANFYARDNGCSPNVSNADYSTDCNVSENTITFTFTILPPL